MKSIWRLAIFFFAAAYVSGADYTQTRSRLVADIPMFKEMLDRDPNDIQIVLGIANLVHCHSLGPSLLYDELFERALELDGHNKPACAMVTRERTSAYANRRREFLENLAEKIAGAKTRGEERLRIAKGRRFYDILKEHGEIVTPYRGKGSRFGVYLLADFDTAPQMLRDSLDAEARQLLEWLGAVQKNDPDNALYNYAKSRCLLLLGEDENAISEIRQGCQKPYLTLYTSELQAATDAVLQMTGYSDADRNIILMANLPFEDYIARGLWKGGLADIAAEAEAQGDSQKARDIYRMATVMADQCQPEQSAPLGLARVATQELKRLEAETAHGAGNGMWALIVAIASVSGAAMFMLHTIRKRQTSKTAGN